MELNNRLCLFHPYVPDEAVKAITETLATRWIGQGPQVDRFEELFSRKFLGRSAHGDLLKYQAALRKAVISPPRAPAWCHFFSVTRAACRRVHFLVHALAC